MAPNDGPKRKDPPAADRAAQTRVKRAKVWDAREIRSEPSHKALNERKELDVGSFVKSHDFEIRALEQSITSSKSALSQRAFQQVPRQLRRRTASHNVKKVPKRLRVRAAREKKEDNTPSKGKKVTGKQRLRDAIALSKRKVDTGKPASTKPAAQANGQHKESIEVARAPILVRKHKKRQLNKSWLPTHMFHAKRAHMTPPMKPLWNFAIPITPTEKSYRQTHRACTLRGCVAWDMSYMSTIQLIGPEPSIAKALGKISTISDFSSENLSKWRQGKQTWTGFLYKSTEKKPPIAPVSIVWNPAEEGASLREVIIRVHPAAFPELLAEIRRVGSMQRPAVEVRDMRFEFGSIEVTGPAATEAIVRVVQPIEATSNMTKKWTALAAVTNVASLPQNPILGFSMEDARLKSAFDNFRQAQTRCSEEELLQLISSWPSGSEKRPFSLFVDQDRKLSQQKKLSQKTIDKWKSEAPREEPTRPAPMHHPIPAILFALQRSTVNGMGGSWVLMLPWEHVLPTWYSLMHVSLLDGGQPRIGGLLEQRQKAFEGGTPWFPGDFPNSAAGWAWELSEREQRLRDWEKRPKSKRIDFSTLDLGHETKGELGRGWACDWEYLCGLEPNNSEVHSKPKQKAAHESTMRDNGMVKLPAPRDCVPREPSPIEPDALAVVSLTFCGRGHASACARIYRVPAAAEQRKAWLSIAPKRLPRERTSTHDRPRQVKSPMDEAADEATKNPPADDLVGFVTSGNYNLGEGQATAIGSIHLQKMLDAGNLTSESPALRGWCIVREAGGTVPRLARWKQQTYSHSTP